MSSQVRKVHYVKMTVSNRVGQGTKILGALMEAGIDLRAFTGFPAGAGKSQVDLLATRVGPIRVVARRHGWKLSATKKAFLVQGTDEIGAVAKIMERLAKAGINVTAVDAAAAGKGRYGMILWVRAKDYLRAARVLHAR